MPLYHCPGCGATWREDEIGWEAFFVTYCPTFTCNYSPLISQGWDQQKVTTKDESQEPRQKALAQAGVKP